MTAHTTAIVDLDVVREEVEAAVGRRLPFWEELLLAWIFFAGESLQVLLAEASHAVADGEAEAAAAKGGVR